MTAQVQKILHDFEKLSSHEQREAASEILHKTVCFNSPPLCDDTLVYSADDLFLILKLDCEDIRSLTSVFLQCIVNIVNQFERLFSG